MPKIKSFTREALGGLSEVLIDAIEKCELPSLGDGPENSGVTDLLVDASFVSELATHLTPLGSELVHCGLWLLAGDLDRSHSISQGISEPEGSFWHGIMHRREGDFGNAKYWFRRVGSHPVLGQLAAVFGEDYVDAEHFVDLCAKAVRSKQQVLDKCVIAQWYEWQALMTHCVTR